MDNARGDALGPCFRAVEKAVFLLGELTLFSSVPVRQLVTDCAHITVATRKCSYDPR